MPPLCPISLIYFSIRMEGSQISFLSKALKSLSVSRWMCFQCYRKCRSHKISFSFQTKNTSESITISCSLLLLKGRTISCPSIVPTFSGTLISKFSLFCLLSLCCLFPMGFQNTQVLSILKTNQLQWKVNPSFPFLFLSNNHPIFLSQLMKELLTLSTSPSPHSSINS